MKICDVCGGACEDNLSQCPHCGQSNAFMREMPYALVFAACTVRGISGYAVSRGCPQRRANDDRSGGCVCIPEERNGKPVLAIGDRAFQYDKSMSAIYISRNVMKIGRSAFEGCTALTQVLGCRQLDNVDACAFRGCVQLSPQCALVKKTEMDFRADSFAGCYRLPAKTEHY